MTFDLKIKNVSTIYSVTDTSVHRFVSVTTQVRRIYTNTLTQIFDPVTYSLNCSVLIITRVDVKFSCAEYVVPYVTEILPIRRKTLLYIINQSINRNYLIMILTLYPLTQKKIIDIVYSIGGGGVQNTRLLSPTNNISLR